MKRFHYIDENNGEQYDRDAHMEHLKIYGFKCDTCEKYYDFFNIHSIKSNNNECSEFIDLEIICNNCLN